ncbi:MAG: transcription-repair coupling factor, partial [Oscillospiraceae bacterium]
MSNIFQTAIENFTPYRDMLNAVKNGQTPVSVSGISGIHKAQFALGLRNNNPVLLICDSEAAANRLAADICAMTGESCAFVYPAKDFTFTAVETVSREYEHTRLGVLSRLAEGESIFVCASAEAVMQATLPREILLLRTVTIESGGEIDLEVLARRLVAAGYTRCDKVEGASQFSVRGAIADVFPVGSTAPVRMELWGDEVDTLSYFDPETQRRTDPVETVKISPAAETLFDSPEALVSALEKLSKAARGKRAELVRNNITRDIDRVNTGLELGDIDKYLPLAYEKPGTIFDYLTEETPVVFCEYHNCLEKSRSAMAHHAEDVKLLLEAGELCKGLEGYMSDLGEVYSKAARFPLLHFDTFLRGADLKFKKLISATANQTAPWGGEIRQLIEDLNSYCGNGYSAIVMAGSEKTLPIIAKDLQDEGVSCSVMTADSVPSKGHVLLTTGCVSSGYDYPDIKTVLITQARAATSKKKFKKAKKGEEIKSLSDIAAGDLVVHALHGIGRFAGIRKLEMEGITKDYITIQYAGTDVLYVPVNQLDMVSKYIGPRDNGSVKLNKLSSMEWQKTRSRVKKAVKDMADELIKLYAKRSQTPGFAFSEDDDWQHDFESRFPYTETDDQLRSIQEIKEDMQKPTPMDRLLCGDVGFGKTEVAFRAAFKCMEDSKQCAILAPTTVLAWQHYQTALKRFEHFPMKIELLSRFRTPKQQEEILRQLKRGEIDMIIGTHRLVQKDVKFLNLGLVIIDEEQRFGVAHKERFKEAFAGVDVLTLSATPIPRTLNMAMSGIRDMSVIEEPPVDRHPVQTYVIEHNMGVIAQAITKELRRGGQVYYIHNRIDSIDMCAAKIQELIPDARIGVAHGQIGEERLSEIWRQLIEHEIDILVCTTLIETGVDVPNVNTLIIEDSDNLGLSQLYQLRGRVGRSSRRAFAYFTFRRGKALTEIASRRLDAIREFTQFGSGFRIALRDLEIRGAGSILGGKQHGHMEAVGYDMYLQLLSEAIAEEKGELPPPKPEDCLIDIQIEAHIPENYIESLAGRLDMYRKIASLRTNEESMDLIDELIDRYGEPPKAIQGLISVALTRNMASELTITEISQKNGIMFFYLKSADMEQIQALTSAYKGRVTVNGGEKSYIAVKMKGEKPVELMQ